MIRATKCERNISLSWLMLQRRNLYTHLPVRTAPENLLWKCSGLRRKDCLAQGLHDRYDLVEESDVSNTPATYSNRNLHIVSMRQLKRMLMGRVMRAPACKYEGEVKSVASTIVPPRARVLACMKVSRPRIILDRMMLKELDLEAPD